MIAPQKKPMEKARNGANAVVEALRIDIDAAGTVSALLSTPPDATACFVFAHGAGAGMTHPFMAAIADGLAGRRIATLRYQFPYMEKGTKRPDRPAIAQATVRAAVAQARQRFPRLTLIAGGKSFGGRMTSQAQALSPMDGVRGLAFFGFPLHAAGKPSVDRAAHLSDIAVPMLFLQGSNDKLGELRLLEPLVGNLGTAVSLHVVKDADHSFHVPARSGRSDSDVLAELIDVFAPWAKKSTAI